MIMYCLQNRWKIEGKNLVYYGLRNKLFKNKVKISEKQRKIIEKLPCDLSSEDIKTLGKLVGEQVVDERDLRETPKNLDEARFCTNCVANDFIIPGLEFDEQGRCPMCQTAEKAKNLKSILPIIDDIPRSKKSRFDVAVFYTGGKDSTFLLYYLAKVKKLRVLALTWEIPYISDGAKQSIENAKKHFETVEFVVRRVSNADLKKFYAKLYELASNTCACPSLAYVLFYPEMVDNKIPYFIAGNEPVQMLGLYYNHMAPTIAYKFADMPFLTFLFNLTRVFTLRPPIKQGQIQSLMTVKQLAYGNPLVKLSGYQNELVTNVTKALHEVPEFLPPLKRAIRRSSMTGNIPAFVHLDFDEICGGKYDWNAVKDILVKECGWVAPDANEKALHTSCKIERCKDRSQFIRFYNCQSKTIPFSALEISLSSKNCGRTREETITEMKNSLGFTLEELPECRFIHEYLDEK